MMTVVRAALAVCMLAACASASLVNVEATRHVDLTNHLATVRTELKVKNTGSGAAGEYQIKADPLIKGRLALTTIQVSCGQGTGDGRGGGGKDKSEGKKEGKGKGKKQRPCICRRCCVVACACDCSCGAVQVKRCALRRLRRPAAAAKELRNVGKREGQTKSH